MAPLEMVKEIGKANRNAGGNEDESVFLNSTTHSNASPQTLEVCISDRQRDFLTAGSRNHTPVRPVYDDFPTAYLSITTGSAKSRHSVGRRDSGDFEGDRHLQPVLPLKLRQREQKSSNLANEPLLPPIPALVTNFRGLDLDFEFEHYNFVSSPSKNLLPFSGAMVESSSNGANQHTGKESPMLNNLKKVWDNISSPGIKITKQPSTKVTKWARCGLERHESTQIGGPLVHNQPAVWYNSFSPLGSNEVGPFDGDIQHISKIDLLDRICNSEYFAEQKSLPLRSKTGERSNITTHKDNKEPEESSRLGAIHRHCVQHSGIESNSKDKVAKIEDKNQLVYSGGFPLVDTNTSSSIGGSTVENFVQRYARSDELDTDGDSDEELILPTKSIVLAKPQLDFSPRSLVNYEADAGNLWEHRPSLLKQSTVGLRRQGRSGRIGESSSGKPPKISLPQLPAAIYQSTFRSTSEGLVQSSSYGDTRNLLEFTQRTQCTSANDSVEAAKHSLFPIAKHSQIVGNISRNYYRRFHKINGPAAVNLPDLSSGNSGPSQKEPLHTSYKATAPQHSLEQDISRALRRESGYSTASRESIIERFGGVEFYGSSKSDLSKRSGLEERSASLGKPVLELGFFDKAAIPSAWLGSQKFDTVRVPIGIRDGNSSSTHPTQSSSGESELLELSSLRGKDDDANDWETVGDSGIVSRAVTIPFGILGGDIDDAGSSLANISDTDDLSIYHAFASTERFMEHPAQIGFSRDNHCRGMKESKIPVLLPSNEGCSVNGFPVNSYRPCQTNAFNFSTPVPLPEHQNPFTSVPPDFAGGAYVKEGDIQSARQSQLRENHQYRCSTTAGSAQNGEPGINNDDSSSSYNWMDDYGDPGPAIRAVQANLVIDELWNPYRQALNMANGNGFSGLGIDGMRTAGSSLADSSTFSDYADQPTPPSTDQQLREPWPSPSEANAANLRLTPRSRNLFVKGPPGAFYRDLRSGPNPCQQRQSDDRVQAFATRSRRRSSLEQSYPTNKMRSLSLLTVKRPNSPLRPFGRHSKERRQSRNEFFFRSPLAEVKSRSWRNLYTRDQLAQHREAAEADGVHETGSISEQSSQPSCGQPEGSWKRIRATPHMFAWPREDSSIKTDTASRKAKISMVVLLICCLFPPVLLLYSIGRLDCLMMWWTNGEICSFRRDHKKWARRLGLFCVMCAILGAAIGFCLHFSRPDISG